jgi:hypothetical protein
VQFHSFIDLNFSKYFYDLLFKFIRDIKHMRERPQFYASYGSFMHKLLEGYYKGDLSKEEMQIKFLFDFSKEVQGARPQESTVRKYIQMGTQYLSDFCPFPYRTLGVEKKMVFSLAGFPFVGYIDYVGGHGDDIILIDHKSRDLKPRSKREKPTVKDAELDDMLKQLYLYAGAVRDEYGRFPKSLCFNCFKTNTFIEEPFKEDAYHAAVDWAKGSIEEIMDADEFQPNLDFFSCKYICGLQDDCCYYQTR